MQTSGSGPGAYRAPGRFLVLSTPVPAALAPALPMLRALRAAGHEVLVAGQPGVVALAAAAGLATATVGGPYDPDAVAAIGLPPGRRPIEAGQGRVPAAQAGRAARTWLVHAKYVLGPYLRQARAWSPDAVIADPREFSAAAVAGTLGVPLVRHRAGWGELDEALVPVARRFLARRLARCEGGPVADPTLVLEWCPPALRAPADTLPTTTAPDAPDGSVVVALGRSSVVLHGRSLVDTVLTALGDRPVVVVLDDDLRTAVDGRRVTVRPTLDLAGAAVVVHSGEATVALDACASEAPQLVLPQQGDEFGYADLAAAAGVALSLDTPEAQNDAAAIRAAVDTLAGPGRYRGRAAALARSGLPDPVEFAARAGALVPARVAAPVGG